MCLIRYVTFVYASHSLSWSSSLYLESALNPWLPSSNPLWDGVGAGVGGRTGGKIGAVYYILHCHNNVHVSQSLNQAPSVRGSTQTRPFNGCHCSVRCATTRTMWWCGPSYIYVYRLSTVYIATTGSIHIVESRFGFVRCWRQQQWIRISTQVQRRHEIPTKWVVT